jgi:hypothetical protein
MISKRSLLDAVLAISLLGTVSAHAALIGPTYPAPGGNNFSSTPGDAGDAGGVTFSYSNFNTSAFSSLYWGSNSGDLPTAGLDGSQHALPAVAVNGQTETYSGLTSYTSPSGGTATIPIELVITITGITNPWVSFSSVNGSDPTGVGYVVNDSSGSPFSANLAFLANTGSGLQAINTIEVGSDGLAKSSFDGAFYSTAAVPLPAAVWLLVSGLGGFIGVFGRRKQPI